MKILHYDNYAQIVADTDNIPNGKQFSLNWKSDGKTWAETHRFNEEREDEIYIDSQEDFGYGFYASCFGDNCSDFTVIIL